MRQKENAEAGKPGAANPPGAVTPKPPPSQPKVAEKPKPIEPQPTPPAKKPQPLPPALVAAWEKAGFTAGWMGPRKDSGYFTFARTLNELDASKAVPALKTLNWKPGMLESLPAPTSAFGLDLGYTKITDAGLKEVAKLQQLTSLVLSRTQITDAGVAELKKALPKCEIHR